MVLQSFAWVGAALDDVRNWAALFLRADHSDRPDDDEAFRTTIVGDTGFHGWRQASARGPTENPAKGFKFGGWVMPYVDQEFGEKLDRVFSEKFDHLFGRKTMRFSRPPGPATTKALPRAGMAKLFKEIKK